MKSSLAKAGDLIYGEEIDKAVGRVQANFCMLNPEHMKVSRDELAIDREVLRHRITEDRVWLKGGLRKVGAIHIVQPVNDAVRVRSDPMLSRPMALYWQHLGTVRIKIHEQLAESCRPKCFAPRDQPRDILRRPILDRNLDDRAWIPIFDSFAVSEPETLVL